MKKHFLIKSVIIAIAAIVMCSCEQTEYKKLIPADAPVVIEFDVFNMALKADVDKYKNDIVELLEGYGKKDAELRALARAIRDDEDNGLDIFSPVFWFFDSELEESFGLCAVLDFDAAKKSLKNADNTVLDKEDDDLYWIKENGQVVGLFTEDAILYGSTSDKTTYRALLRQDEKHSFFATNAGKLLKRNAEDISIALNAKALSGKTKRDMYRGIDEFFGLNRGDAESALEDIIETETVIGVEFGDGQVGVKVFVHVDDDSKNSLELLLIKGLKEGKKALREKQNSYYRY